MSSDADKDYLKKHGIPALFNEITQDLFRDRPEQPVPYLIELLKAKKAARASAPTVAPTAAAATK